MDLITADPSASTSGSTGLPPSSASASANSASQQPTTGSVTTTSSSSSSGKTILGEKKSKRATLMQIQSDTISAAKAALNPMKTNIMPQKQKKKVLEPVPN